MTKRIIDIPFTLCLLIIILLIGSLPSQGQSADNPIKVGDYVEFGNYLNARILWRVMELKDGNPILWSEYVLCSKCFDAAESGKSDEGSDDAQKSGSNLWSKSNLREWLNSAGKVNWSTRPPTRAAVMWGKYSYENEPGFLTGFSKAERDMLVPTERVIIGYYFNREVETTRDLVFLPVFEEVNNGGVWGLSDESRKKFPTPAAMAKNPAMPILFKEGYGYQYFLMTPHESDQYAVRAVTFEGVNSDRYSANNGCVGVVPAVQISAVTPKSGVGSHKNPWKF